MPKKNISTDDLAVIIKNEFDNVKSEFDNVRNEFKKASAERKALRRDLEEIKLKFAYTAWQIDLEEIKKRLVKVEKKLKVKNYK